MTAVGPNPVGGSWTRVAAAGRHRAIKAVEIRMQVLDSYQGSFLRIGWFLDRQITSCKSGQK